MLINREVTNELKGFAIVAIILAHIGYGIFQTNIFGSFADYAGVGVDIFYFLSAYGLYLSISERKRMKISGVINETTDGLCKKDVLTNDKSEIKNSDLKPPKVSYSDFYKKRMIRLLPYVWAILLFFFTLDFIVYGTWYGWVYTIQSFLLIFPSADLLSDVNSPLWYITPLVIYYLAFPFVYNKLPKYISPVVFLLIGYALTKTTLVDYHFTPHYLAFPLGIIVAQYSHKSTEFLQRISARKIVRSILLGILFLLIIFGTNFTFVGTSYEIFGTSLLLFVLAFFCLLKPLRIKLLTFVGTISFELYLVHWPLMSRFDVLYFLREFPLVWVLSWFVVLISIAHLIRVYSRYFINNK